MLVLSETPLLFLFASQLLRLVPLRNYNLRVEDLLVLLLLDIDNFEFGLFKDFHAGLLDCL
jgi:hypothetical protein